MATTEITASAERQIWPVLRCEKRSAAPDLVGRGLVVKLRIRPRPTGVVSTSGTVTSCARVVHALRATPPPIDEVSAGCVS